MTTARWGDAVRKEADELLKLYLRGDASYDEFQRSSLTGLPLVQDLARSIYRKESCPEGRFLATIFHDQVERFAGLAASSGVRRTREQARIIEIRFPSSDGVLPPRMLGLDVEAELGISKATLYRQYKAAREKILVRIEEELSKKWGNADERPNETP